MSERLGFIAECIKEVLGPRYGTLETIPFQPDNDAGYITGWLAARSAEGEEILDRAALPQAEAGAVETELNDFAADQEDDPELDLGEAQDADDQDAGPSVAGIRCGTPLPSLEPGRMPALLGISFLAQGAPVRFEVCATWARYSEQPPGTDPAEPASTRWQRQVLGAIHRFEIPASQDELEPISLEEGAALEFRLGRPRLDGVRSLAVFLVNRALRKPEEARTPKAIFQPQIRIRLLDGTVLEPWSDLPSAQGDADADRMRLLYRGRPIFARGHLCGAIWRACDPERPDPELAVMGIPCEFPFVWMDGREAFPDGRWERFVRPDLRTDFAPMATVFSPEPNWKPEIGQPPILAPWDLAQCRDAEAIGLALEPLPRAYRSWISTLEARIPALEPVYRRIAEDNLGRCRVAADRIEQGIRLLQEDEDARLAFGFANQAMGLQAVWSRKQRGEPAVPFPWRPFQLAFLLQELPAVVDRAGPPRETCDLIWFPTGGGKTEAYLAVAAFVLAWRRLAAIRSNRPEGQGVAVLSRYTLRLLTIQQYRRALAMVTACEFLRSVNWLPGGWPVRPRAWGGERFGIGLWVGNTLTPGRLRGNLGALRMLQQPRSGDAEPAQVLTCPCCGATLAVTADQLKAGEKLTLHWVCRWSGGEVLPMVAPAVAGGAFQIQAVAVSGSGEFRTLSVETTLLADVAGDTLPAIQRIWDHLLAALLPHGLEPELEACLSRRPDRPGYFIREARWGRMPKAAPVDFEIICPAPGCDLAQPWNETRQGRATPLPEPFRDGNEGSTRIPVPAATVDDQVLARCPSMLVATVDKFARLPFTPEAGMLFGWVDLFDPDLGYWRQNLGQLPAKAASPAWTPVEGPFLPPDLLIQDELHLIEGPLGSMVGLYETCLDFLMSRWEGRTRVFRPLLLASSATVRAAADQVRALFDRDLQVFPPPGLDAADSFFARTDENLHPLDPSRRGRTYLGLCAPGAGPLVPARNLWARVLQHGQDRLKDGAPAKDLDGFWTPVNYYSAIRELAGASKMVAQDVQERLAWIQPDRELRRPFRPDRALELSSRVDSLRLPGLLDQLAVTLQKAPDRCPDMLHTTSMFGTGVDVSRLSLMVVHGQPKTASAYIQATGRVGREAPGLLLVLLRATRPRDLSHYEFFAGYHGALYRHVEPITLAPFSPRAMERALGPLAVLMLRLGERIEDLPIPRDFRQNALAIERLREDPALDRLAALLEDRAQAMPEGRRPGAGECLELARSAMDVWRFRAGNHQDLDFVYDECTLFHKASKMVVLGGPAHAELEGPGGILVSPGCAFGQTPNSLREVEATAAFGERCTPGPDHASGSPPPVFPHHRPARPNPAPAGNRRTR